MIMSAGIIVVNTLGQVLAQHRDDNPGITFPGYWCIPGGRLQDGEIPETGAKREVLEETGYWASKLELLDERDVMTKEGLNKQYIYWTKYDNIQKISCFEGQEVRFVDLTQLAREIIQPHELELFARVATFVPVGFYEPA